MSFPQDPSASSRPPSAEEPGDGSSASLPSIRIDRSTAEPKRASAPPLSIAHVMLFTASSAAILTVQRLWLSELGTSDKSATFLGFVTLYAVAAGPALASLVLRPVWRSRGYRFPVHPGEWLLWLNGWLVLLGMVRAVTRYLEAGDLLLPLAVRLGHLVIVIALCGLSFRRGDRRAAWRWLFFLWALAILSRNVLGVYELNVFLYGSCIGVPSVWSSPRSATCILRGIALDAWARGLAVGGGRGDEPVLVVLGRLFLSARTSVLGVANLRCCDGPIHPRPRPRHHLQPGDRVRPRRPARWPSAQQEFPQILPAPGHVEHDPEAIWSIAAGRRPRGAGEGQAHGGRHRRDRRHQPARDDDPLGARHRQAGRQRHRLAKPHQCADLRAAQGGRARADLFAEKTGLVVDAYFSGTKIKHLLDTIAGLRPRGRARRNPVRHGRFVSHLAADRRQAARHRLQQRQPHAALQHSHARLGRRAAAICSISRGPCCPRCGRRAKSTAKREPSASAAPIPDRRRRGRPAGGHVRPGLLRAGQREEHLRHRLLHAAEHGREAGRLAEQAADHHRLGTRRQDDVLPGRLGVHRRRGRAVAARWAGSDQSVGRRRSAGRQRARCRRRVLRAGLRRPGCAVLGSLRPRGDLRPRRAARRAAHIARAAVESMAYQTRDLLEAMQRDAGCRWPS